MPRIWTKRKEIRAGFYTRSDERKHGEIRTVANLETQSDEVQALEHNRVAISEYLEWSNVQLSMGKQVHDTNVAITDNPEICNDTDGLVTTRSGLAVGVLVADCAAVLLADRAFGVVAAVHAGWRGAVSGIVTKAIHHMIRLGAEPHLMEAYISPCISRSAFEVGDEVAERFPERYVDRSDVKPHIDLGKYVFDALTENGVPAERIEQDDRCTMHNDDELHSYRRDGTGSGRMMAVIGLD